MKLGITLFPENLGYHEAVEVAQRARKRKRR